MTDHIQVKDGFMYGPWIKGVNRTGIEVRQILEARGEEMAPWRGSKIGSIHDNSVAQKIGMRGAVVEGVAHLDLFQPLMLEAFGPEWFERGTISMFYTFAILHGEEIRAIIQAPPKGADNVQVEARVELKNGQLVAQGTVSVGSPKEKSYVQSMSLKSSPKEERRIFKELDVGWEIPPRDEMMSLSKVLKDAEFCEETIKWNLGQSPWGSAVIPPSRVFIMMRMAPSFTPAGVGFYGATELRYINGPALADVEYQADGKMIAVGVTSKTEYFWFDSRLVEKETGKVVAELRNMTRNMKAGSPLYPEL